MPRQPNLRKKKIRNCLYWFTETGGATYFGNVADVPYAEAQRLFAEHVKSGLKVTSRLPFAIAGTGR